MYRVKLAVKSIDEITVDGITITHKWKRIEEKTKDLEELEKEGKIIIEEVKDNDFYPPELKEKMDKVSQQMKKAITHEQKEKFDELSQIAGKASTKMQEYLLNSATMLSDNLVDFTATNMGQATLQVLSDFNRINEIAYLKKMIEWHDATSISKRFFEEYKKSMIKFDALLKAQAHGAGAGSVIFRNQLMIGDIVRTSDFINKSILTKLEITGPPSEKEPPKKYQKEKQKQKEVEPKPVKVEVEPEKVATQKETLEQENENLKNMITNLTRRVNELEKIFSENTGNPKAGSENKPGKKRLPKSERKIIKIVWRGEEGELEILFQELVYNHLLSKSLEYSEFLDHFNIEGIVKSNERTKIKKIMWHGTEIEIIYLVSKLVKKKKWPKSRQYKLVEYHFLNRDGNPFKARQLSVTFDHLPDNIPYIDEILKKIFD